MRRSMPALAALLLMSTSAHAEEYAAEFEIGIGVFALAKNGSDLRVSFRLPQSPYRIGFRKVGWTDTFHDPFTGRALTNTHNSMNGPFVEYLFRPEENSSFYAGLALLNWSRTEEALLVNTPAGSASTTNLYFGGGYLKRFASHGFFNLGMYLGPSAKLNTQTTVSSEQSSGGFDTVVQIGLVF